jgi:hypothetical protein
MAQRDRVDIFMMILFGFVKHFLWAVAFSPKLFTYSNIVADTFGEIYSINDLILSKTDY